MKNRATTILLLIVMYGASITANAGTNETGTTSEIGSVPCGQWIEDHNNQAFWPKTVENQWLAGFLSGEAISLDVDILANTNLKSLALWVTNFCNANPLSNSLSGALELAGQIAKDRGLCARGYQCQK
jgi:hypothetical protein